MANQFMPAFEARSTLQQIIQDYHGDLNEHCPHIKCMYQASPITVNGKEAVLKVSKVSGINAYMARPPSDDGALKDSEPFFLVMIHQETWNLMTSEMQIYRLDCAAQAMSVEYNEDEETLAMRIERPDIQTYSQVAKRHRTEAMADVATLVRAIGLDGQTRLLLDSDAMATAKSDSELSDEDKARAAELVAPVESRLPKSTRKRKETSALTSPAA